MSEPVDRLREDHEDEPTARRLMELATDAEWSDKADLAAWTRVVRDIRGPVRALAAAPAEDRGDAQVIEWLREALEFSEEWAALASELITAQRLAARQSGDPR